MSKVRLIVSALALLAAAPALAAPTGDEPVAVPSTIRQGVDFVYVDPQMSSVARRHQRPQNWLAGMFGNGGQANRAGAPNPFFADLSRGLADYKATWGKLPQTRIPAGPVLKPGASGKRVDLLRQRLGLAPGAGYDDALSQAVASYQRAHALTPSDGIAGKATLTSLNRGSVYYEQRLAINVERAFRLPKARTFDRYVIVDSGAAEAYLIDHDRVVDQMRVVVGATATKTPMMAVLMRSARANPYWNVPPELVRSLTAARIGKQGLTYLDDFHYEVLSDWSATARPIDPARVHWKAIASGAEAPSVRVRQLPGPWNSMGAMKFEMPNDFGIYLHDTPHKELFAKANRWVSNGCVRLEDYRRFATWVFGRMPDVDSPVEQRFELPAPVPIYLTYLTATASGGGVAFRPDPYGFDAPAAAQMFAAAGKRSVGAGNAL